MGRKKKIRRKRHAALARKALDEWTPAPRHAVYLPFVDDITALAVRPDVTPESKGNGSPAAQFVDEVCMILHGRIIGTPFRLVKGAESATHARDFRNVLPHTEGMAKRERKIDAIEAGVRLRATREALGYKTIRRFAQVMDEPESNVTKWENGEARVRASFITKLYEMHGVTHGWIYAGIRKELPHDLAIKLMQPPAE